MLSHSTGVGQSLCTPKSTPTRTYRAPNAQHRVAAVQYDNVLRSERASSGILRNPPSIAFDYHVLNEANGNGCEIVQVYLIDTGTLYTVSMVDYWQHGKIQTRNGEQVILSLKFWSVDGQQPEATHQTEVQTAQAEAASVTQGSLFGGAG